jgi:hypothetical protein
LFTRGEALAAGHLVGDEGDASTQLGLVGSLRAKAVFVSIVRSTKDLPLRSMIAFVILPQTW